MALIKLNNRAVKDATAFGSITSLGSLTFISKQTASSSASISFTGIDSTYKEYMFVFNNIRPATGAPAFQFNLSTDGGSSYDVTKTTTFFNSRHNEADTETSLSYDTGSDLAQSTSYQRVCGQIKSDSDTCYSGIFFLYNPSSTTFVKHFIANGSLVDDQNANVSDFMAGYGNTTSAINAIDFKMSSGNIDVGTISLFGIA
jgi:hypothetical protein